MTSGHRVDVRANANKAENSNQGVGNHNIASIVCCDHRAARSLGSAIIAVVIIVAIVCGVIFGLRDRNNNSHDAQ